VDIEPEVEETLLDWARRVTGAVVVSAHVGNWEMLLGLANVFRHILPVMFLVEASFSPGLNRFLADVRGTGGGESESREGGAGALGKHVRTGGVAGLVLDRNVRRDKGGLWAPFFGLQARTTPLPAMLARGNDVPIAPIFCLPTGDGRYRIHLGDECSLDVRSGDYEADLLEITTRLNRQVEEVILAQPEAWNWTLKRFKSRPTEELGRYPPYSLHDP
jgi:KDO2-lipid IV(A) lauroyltransferase